MLKLIPHIPNASWVIKQSVGTVPVILGNKLKTTFYRTDRCVVGWGAGCLFFGGWVGLGCACQGA